MPFIDTQVIVRFALARSLQQPAAGGGAAVEGRATGRNAEQDGLPSRTPGQDTMERATDSNARRRPDTSVRPLAPSPGSGIQLVPIVPKIF